MRVTAGSTGLLAGPTSWRSRWAAAGFILMVADRKRRPEVMSAEALDQAADQLAGQVLSEEGMQRARLLGTDAVTVTAANVTFDRADRLVEFEEASTGSRGDLNTIAQVLPERHTADGWSSWVILGSGKTVLALELLVRLLEQRRDQRSDHIAAIGPVPVRLSHALVEYRSAFRTLAVHSAHDPIRVGSRRGQRSGQLGPHPAGARRAGRDGPRVRWPRGTRGDRGRLAAQRVHQREQAGLPW